MIQPIVRTEKYGLNSFRYQGSKLWNTLPPDITLAASVSSFKNLLLKWYDAKTTWMGTNQSYFMDFIRCGIDASTHFMSIVLSPGIIDRYTLCSLQIYECTMYICQSEIRIISYFIHHTPPATLYSIFHFHLSRSYLSLNSLYLMIFVNLYVIWNKAFYLYASLIYIHKYHFIHIDDQFFRISLQI